MTGNPTPPPSDEEPLVHVGWWCWRGDNHGHLATTACRSDNVPLHVPAEWADEMRAVIQRIEDGDEDEAPAVPVPPTTHATVLRQAADAIDATFTGPGNDRYVRYGADLLRRMADEAQQQKPDDTETLLAAAICSAQYHGDEDGARLCIRAAQHTGKAHTDEHGFHWSDTVAMYPLGGGAFRTGVNLRAALAAAPGPGRVADEGQPKTPLRHAADVCPGFPGQCPNIRTVDPDPPVHYGGIRCGCADEAPL